MNSFCTSEVQREPVRSSPEHIQLFLHLPDQTVHQVPFDYWPGRWAVRSYQKPRSLPEQLSELRRFSFEHRRFQGLWCRPKFVVHLIVGSHKKSLSELHVKSKSQSASNGESAWLNCWFSAVNLEMSWFKEMMLSLQRFQQLNKFFGCRHFALRSSELQLSQFVSQVSNTEQHRTLQYLQSTSVLRNKALQFQRLVHSASLPALRFQTELHQHSWFTRQSAFLPWCVLWHTDSILEPKQPWPSCLSHVLHNGIAKVWVYLHKETMQQTKSGQHATEDKWTKQTRYSETHRNLIREKSKKQKRGREGKQKKKEEDKKRRKETTKNERRGEHKKKEERTTQKRRRKTKNKEGETLTKKRGGVKKRRKVEEKKPEKRRKKRGERGTKEKMVRGKQKKRGRERGKQRKNRMREREKQRKNSYMPLGPIHLGQLYSGQMQLRPMLLWPIHFSQKFSTRWPKKSKVKYVWRTPVIKANFLTRFVFESSGVKTKKFKQMTTWTTIF